MKFDTTDSERALNALNAAERLNMTLDGAITWALRDVIDYVIHGKWPTVSREEFVRQLNKANELIVKHVADMT